MSDNQKPEGTPEEAVSVSNLPVTIHAQYIRDLSFENPGAPETLKAGLGAPEMDVNIGMDARALDEDKEMFEVVLNISAVAKREDKNVFLAEVVYGATVSLNNVPENQHHPMLLIEIPRMLFPFARQVIADCTAQGGFPPLLLNPVDFYGLYMSRFGKEIEENQKQAQA